MTIDASRRLGVKVRFLENNKTWLDSSISFPNLTLKRGGPGHPKITFDQSTKRMKRQKTLDLRKSTPLTELVYATQMELRATGQKEASIVITDILSDSSSPSKYLIAYRNSLETVTMSGGDAVAVVVEAGLSRHQYNVIRSNAPKLYPSYKILQAAKKECYPETAKIKNQDLVTPMMVTPRGDFLKMPQYLQK